MFEIQELDAVQAQSVLPDLVELLRDAVDGGASVSFWPPLSEDEARGYWLKVLDELRAGTRCMLIARKDDAVVGTVQLKLATVPNGRHRAEVEKLLVLRSARRQGIARALLVALEDVARAAGRRLLVLDTRRGDAAETLYHAHGYTELGVIPRATQRADGTLEDTVFFYRWLDG